MEIFKNSPHRAFLAIDSSTQLASVALSVGGQLLFSEECIRQKSHSEWINGAINRAMGSWSGHSWRDLDLIAVTQGPGSFTGLRVATNLAKTLAYAQGKPIVSFSSLEVLAHQRETEARKDKANDKTLVLPMINAFKNMVFFSLYEVIDSGLKKILEDQAIEIENLESYLYQNNTLQLSKSDRVQIIGDGFEVYKNYFTSSSESWWVRSLTPKDHPLASTLASMVWDRWNNLTTMTWRELTPTYIRASAAEEARRIQSN